MIKNKNHCSKCGFDIKIVFRKASIVYNCLECGYRIPTDTKICKKDGAVGYKETVLKSTSMVYKCNNCGFKKIGRPISENKPMDDILFNKVRFDRGFVQALANHRGDDANLVKKFLSSLDKKRDIDCLKNYMLPRDMLSNITKLTKCDKGVEKSYLENIIYWFFSTFMSGNLENLAINAASNQSARTVSRSLTDNSVISANALGVRLGNDKVVNGLEKLLEYCTARAQTKIFDNNGDLRPVFYDWMYITKSGDSWKICDNMPRSEEFHGFKIGVGMDWNTKSIVSLVFHGEEHPNDIVSFQRDLCINNAHGLIHITDRGAFDTQFMQLIHERSQYFIIRLKKNIKFITKHTKKYKNAEIELQIASKPKIRVLETRIIELNANQNLTGLKYVKFQYNNHKSGRFETIELVSNLQLDTIDIIELSAQRWRATETEFNILQHGFGLEKVYVRDPSKVWPLFLIAIICKSLFQRVLTAIHLNHGGELDMAKFKINLGIVIEHIARGSGNKLPLSPCNAILCPYRTKHGVRLK